MLELRKITKVYETEDLKQTALNKVSICFRENEFVSILGPSGSGKTTLLNIIGGLDHYDKGDLRINEVSTKDFKSADWDSYRNHRVGFVFQSYNLISHQTVLSNVELALTLSGVSKKTRRARAKKALKEVGLEKHMNKRPAQLSGGQMQRVAIARALVNDPDIVLADEPTGALDSETSVQIMNLLKEIAGKKLVIMVTHNPDLAKEYSTRIIKIKDGEIVNDSKPYDGSADTKESLEVEKKKSKKTSMSLKTALGLSMNNLMTKKGRTILTAFAGSIGIIGIALIMSLSNGIQEYIDHTEQSTLSNYPLTLRKESVDMSTILSSFMLSARTEAYDDDKIHANNIMGDMFTTLSKEVETNDLKSFKKYIESDEGKVIRDNSSDISYGFDVPLYLYKNSNTEVLRVNPTKVMDAIGMSTSGISSSYSSMMNRYDVFSELVNNRELLERDNNVVAGRWPEAYNEVVIKVDKNNLISDYTLYSLGILSQDELSKQFKNMVSGKDVTFEAHEYNTDELVGLSFKLVLPSDHYKKQGNMWIDMSEDEKYMKTILAKAPEIKVVGIIKPDEESSLVDSNSMGIVCYTHALTEYIVEHNQNSQIIKEQLAKKDTNVFTGVKFSNSSSNTLDYSTLSQEQLAYIQSLSPEELSELMATYQANATATYENNATTLGIAELDNPDKIFIYPNDFDSKAEIKKAIEKYNEGKSDDEKLTYQDAVEILTSSVSTIVNVVSSVLIAFVAISLIVSSIMIAIITYISVLERTKEIGILRAIGASKKDVSRVFNAETLIEGFVAGLFGVVITIILDFPINAIIKEVVGISNIASLPIIGAFALIAISILLTFIAGLIPSRMASKKDPVEALRSE